MATAPHNPTLTFAKLSALSLGAAVVFAILAFGPAAAIGGSENISAMLLGTAAALVGSLLAALPPAICLSAPAQTFAMASLAGLMVRFVATMSVGLGLKSMQLVSGDGLLIWSATAQMALLACDVTFLVRLAKTREAKTA